MSTGTIGTSEGAAIAAPVASTKSKPANKTKSTDKVKAATTPVNPAPVEKVPFSLERLLKDAVKEASPKVRTAVVDSLVQKELSKREKAVMAAIVEIEEVRISIKQIKPDNSAFDENGNLVSATYTKENAEKIKQKRERLSKLEKAIASALDPDVADFGPILNATGGK